MKDIALGAILAVLPASVDGKSADFFLDTGATFTSAVDLENIKTYRTIRKMSFQGIGSASQEGEVVNIKQLIVGSKIFENKELVRVSSGGGRKNTIGMDLFKDQNLYFQFKTKNLSFQKSPPPEGARNPLYIGKKGHIYLMAQPGLKSHPITSFWDTGAGLTLVDPSVIRENPDNFLFLKKTSGGDTTGAAISLDLYKMKILVVGHETFRDITVLVADLTSIRKAIGDDVRVAIGFNIITQRDWFFDLKNKTWSSRQF